MTDFYSPDYRTARDRFRAGVLANDGQIESILLDSRGPDEDDLTVDIGWFGSSAPQRVFIHSSGLRGIEGFAGSAIQLQWLDEGMPRLHADTAIAVVHAMNPYGMAWLRRANENNVDLNRNFLAADEEYAGAPEHYAALNGLLNPATPPSRDFFRLRAALAVTRYGTSALRRAMSSGQYDFPAGLCFGGKQRAQVARRFQLYLSGRLAWADRVVGIDVHTGPGDFGEDTLLVDGAPDHLARDAEMQAAYGDRVQALDALETRGTLGSLYFRMFPGARVCFAVQEFGVGGMMSALSALRDENRHHNAGGGSVDHPAKGRLLKVFCPADEVWRGKVLARGKEVIAQGLRLTLE